MTRRTSIETYRQIEAEGLINKLAWDVYRVLFNHGPLTQKEVVARLAPGQDLNQSYTPRFAELLRMGALEIVGERPCTITGRNVYVWDVTDKVPKRSKKESKPTRNELIRHMYAQLEEITDYLEDRQNTPAKWQEWAAQSRRLLAQAELYTIKKAKKYSVQKPMFEHGEHGLI